MLNLNLLNKKADKILSGNLLDKYTPFYCDFSQAIELSKKEEIISITSGHIKTFENKKCNISDDDCCILTIPIGYMAILRMQEDDNLFNFLIYNQINLVLGAFYKEFGNLKGREIIAYRYPSTHKDKTYFTEMEECAAVELRFLLLKKGNEI